MKRSFAPLLLFAFSAALSVHAQSAPAISAQPTETVITASAAEIWSNETGTETFALFNGNVVVTGTNLRITCDRIDATAAGRNEDPATASPAPSAARNTTAADVDKFKRILATGKVRIIQGDREAHCERAEVFPREGKIILTGQPVVIDHGANVVFTGEPMTLLKNERRVLGDNVKITFPPIKDLGFDPKAPAPKSEPDAPAK